MSGGQEHVKNVQCNGDKESWLEAKKSMKTILRRKKCQFELERTKDLARKKAKNPGGFWEDIKKKPYNDVESLSLETMLEHYQSLYSK